jgi:hypothetical protein
VTDLERRLRQIEAALRGRLPEPDPLDVEQVFAEWRELSADPRPPSPLPPEIEAMAGKQLGDEDVIGFHRRLPQFQAKRMDWRRFGVLAKRRQMPAPRLTTLPALMTSRRKLAWRKEPVASSYFDPDGMQ